jgi:phage recombination protein Bet
MSNELIKQSDQEGITERVVEDYLFSTKTKLTPEQKRMFLRLCVELGLNPFKREIFAVSYGGDFNFITSYSVYLKRAERSGLLNGWSCETIREEGQLKGAKVTIYRKDWDHPFEWTVSLSEFARTNNSWRAMPEFMIRKVCIAQSFRLAFPEEVGGLPYIAEEITDASEPSNEVTPEPVEVKQNPAESVEVTTEPNSDAETRLREAKTLQELKEIWQSLSPADQKKLKPIKDAMKEKIERGDVL